jgi:HK97 family phage major capsid protein
MTAAAVGNGVNRGVRRYAEARGSRRALRKALGPDTDPGFCFADFLYRVAVRDEKALRDNYGSERSKAAMSATGGGGGAGGWLVPTELRLDLMADVSEEALIRPKATVVEMTSTELRLPMPDATTAQTAGTAPFFGGILMAWTGETQVRPETEPTFRQLTLRTWDLAGYALASNNLMGDGGPGLESWLRKLFARSIAWYEDYAYLRGDGVGKPVGIIDAPATKAVTRQTASQFTQQDAYNMAEALLPASWDRACWAAHPLLWEWLTKLGSTQWQVNMPMDDAPGGPRPHFILQGLPGYFSSKLPALNTRGDMILFDPQLYVIGDRGAVEIEVSGDEPTAWSKNQAVWRVIYRGDGQPWLNQPVTIADASTTVSPFVVLV